MPVNLGLAQLSNHFLIGTVVLYSLALLAYAGDFAFGRHPAKALVKATGSVAAEAQKPALVAAGVPAAAGPVAGTGGPAPAADLPSVPGTPGPRDLTRASWLPAGRWLRVALLLNGLGFAVHLTGVVIRGLAVHRVPWGDMYEFVTAVTCVAVLFFLALMIRYRAYYLGLFVMTPVLLALGIAETVIYTPAGPLVPALHSYWLAIHVTAMTLATGTFVVGAALAVAYLLADRYARRVADGRQSPAVGIFRLLPAPEVIDRFAYRTVMFAFPIWTFGIMAGAIWADEAWGRYWGWDPTETWAFITWVVYACFLHARATAGWRGRRAAYIQLIGFGCLLFNLMGVSIFITGLHSYAGLS
jgi:cytochrome c-type biogenesis protein CcsB